MKPFDKVDATTLADATAALTKYNGSAFVIAGGTSLLDALKRETLAVYPQALVNIKGITSLSYIKEDSGFLKIGALTRLADIWTNTTVQSKYAALASAAHAVGVPQLRNMGTIGGNISQLVRCWYFRASGNRFPCTRKGGSVCYALTGNNRYHSIFGALSGCVAVNPGDTAPVLVAMNANIVTTKKTMTADKFFGFAVPGSTTLDKDEIITEIQIPTPLAGVKTAFVKFAERKALDFPVVNCAAMIGAGDARICLNAVYNTPYRVTQAETLVKGQTITDTLADSAGTAAVQNAVALANNKWKIPIAKAMVKRAILACK
jgi:xanthine dehydrogenase YagS FAD-binding subunit